MCWRGRGVTGGAWGGGGGGGGRLRGGRVGRGATCGDEGLSGVCVVGRAERCVGGGDRGTAQRFEVAGVCGPLVQAPGYGGGGGVAGGDGGGFLREASVGVSRGGI